MSNDSPDSGGSASIEEELGIDAELQITARNPETGEEEVVVDTEEGIMPEDAEIEIIEEPNDAQTR